MSVLDYMQCNDCRNFIWDEGAEDICDRLLFLTCEDRSDYINSGTGKTSLEMRIESGEVAPVLPDREDDSI